MILFLILRLSFELVFILAKSVQACASDRCNLSLQKNKGGEYVLQIASNSFSAWLKLLTITFCSNQTKLPESLSAFN